MPLDSSHQGEAEARCIIGDRCEGKQTVRLLEEPQIQMKVFPKLQLEKLRLVVKMFLVPQLEKLRPRQKMFPKPQLQKLRFETKRHKPSWRILGYLKPIVNFQRRNMANFMLLLAGKNRIELVTLKASLLKLSQVLKR